MQTFGNVQTNYEQAEHDGTYQVKKTSNFLNDGNSALVRQLGDSAGRTSCVIRADDSSSIDAFGRWRVSNPETLFDSKLIHDSNPLFWDDQETSGSGTGSSHGTNIAAQTISVSASTAGTRTRQTFQRFNYQPGKSMLIYMTTKMNNDGTGIKASVGYFDDENGLFFTNDEGTMKVVRRTKTSGSVVDNEVTQANWNLDTMDGTGPSGITIDPTKTQILVIDFEWLGVGRVRMGFVIDGKYYYCHEFLNTNNLTTVYMSTPNLPIRYEISNDGNGEASTLDHICTTVMSEGGFDNNGIVFSDNLSNSVVNTNTAGTIYALIGIRLKTTNLDSVVKVVAETVLGTTSNDNFLWELRFNPTVAGTFTYSDYGVTGSAVQIAKGDTSGNPSTNTVTGGQVVRSGYVTSFSPQRAEVSTARHLGSAIDGTRDSLVLCVTPITSNIDVTGSITWRELR